MVCGVPLGVKVSADGAGLSGAGFTPGEGHVIPAIMKILQSVLLGDVRHGFSTRLGGVSEGRHASLNLGRNWGDDLARVDENRVRLAHAGGFEPGRLRTVRQEIARVYTVLRERELGLASGPVGKD